MKQSYLVGILAFVTLLADVTSMKMACEEHSMCGTGQCCVFGACMPFVPVGKRCSLLQQIMSVQCPCAIGSSCRVMKTSKSSTKIMSCQNIKDRLYLEMVENRDWKHIDSNTVEDQKNTQNFGQTFDDMYDIPVQPQPNVIFQLQLIQSNNAVIWINALLKFWMDNFR